MPESLRRPVLESRARVFVPSLAVHRTADNLYSVPLGISFDIRILFTQPTIRHAYTLAVSQSWKNSPERMLSFGNQRVQFDWPIVVRFAGDPVAQSDRALAF